MIDFEEELKKYKPFIEVDDVEEELNNEKLNDMVDILKRMMNSTEKKGNN